MNHPPCVPDNWPDSWPDDEDWEVFLPDGNPYDPEPAPGDFWIGDEPDEFERLAA